ncbi:trafficking protein particle complex subunit 11-like [Corticium candelabrum]|uniref:trafficking protein particle complex subunit 11-like n=1 Tax=Corticium candelabrum TaxID=121492 RepID=UPI002E26BA3A|nr:trafficking protein particle complex subunit 11-like [Corticium candelabrum]
MAEFPSELLARPLPLVALVGLDVVHNAVHRMIWHTFAVDRRTDRAPINFQCFPGDHDYPKAKAKRTTYESYTPKGILKQNWIKKHLQQVPAVLALFYDLDWEDQQWKERQIECASRVESMRAGLQGHNTKVALVLIQTRSTNLSGDDVVARERAAMLCNECNLSSNSLFFLPTADRLLGYIMRLETEFYELCQQYYQGECRLIKNRRELLHRPTQLFLFVRHQFKIAFYSEMRQDTAFALRHYLQADNFIHEAKANKYNLLELQFVSGFITYKICKFCFQTGQPRDAIAQFRRHIDFYRDLSGYRDLEFEHYAWLSKQFNLFAELFDKAVDNGLEAIQILHPGFFYHQAAIYASIRKQLCEMLCSSQAHKKTSKEVSLQASEFFGQRHWRLGLIDSEPSSEEEESEGIFLVQCQETKVDHSAIIVSLLANAVNQFNRHRSSRMRQFLRVQMANEYYYAGDFIKALKLFQYDMWEYRKEHWWLFLTPILKTALKCAYLSADWQQYVTIGLELVGNQPIGMSNDERSRILTNLIRIVSNEPPEPEPDCVAPATDEVLQLWQEPAKKESRETESQHADHKFLVVHMKEMAGFVQCKANFLESEAKADSPVIVLVHLRSTAPLPVRFSKLSVFFNIEAYNQHCVLTDSESLIQDRTERVNDVSQVASADFCLVPGKISTYKMMFAALPESVNDRIEITSVTLELGSLSTGRCAVLSWEHGGGDAGFKPYPEESDEWDLVKTQPIIQIKPKDSLLDLELRHQQPALIGEFYSVEVVLTVKEASLMNDVKLLLGLKESTADAVPNTYVCLDKPDPDPIKKLKFVSIELGSLQPGSQYRRHLFLKAEHQGTKTVAARILYNINVTVEPLNTDVLCSCMKETFSPVQIISPFDVTLKLATIMKFETIDRIHAGEPFFIMSDISCLSPWPISIITSQLEIMPPVESPDGDLMSQIEEVTLCKDDIASECHCLVVPCSSNIPKATAVGQYTIKWKRSAAVSDDFNVTTLLALPTIVIETIPFWIETDLPAYGSVSSALPARYTFHNRTNRVQEMKIELDSSDACLFSGYKQISFRVLPHGKHSLTFNLLPLSAGNVFLPRLRLSLPLHPTPLPLDTLVQGMLPSSIFVKPANTPDALPTALQEVDQSSRGR